MECTAKPMARKRKVDVEANVDADANANVDVDTISHETWDKRQRSDIGDESDHDDDAATKDGSSNLFDEIARELNSLTMQERETILHQLHGVSNETIINESPQVIAESLANMQMLLEEERHKQSNDLLRLAERQYPGRMADPNFRLMFLRAEDFDVRAAVERILAHLDMQQFLFGNDKVGKRITLDDMSASDMRALQNGHFQILREKDRAGRLVAFDSIRHRKEADYEHDSLVRIGFYSLMAAVEGDDLAQRKGIVFVFSYLGTSRNRKTNGDSFQKATRMFNSVPLKSRGLHACMNPNKILEMFHHFRTFWEKDSRLRIRIHQGTFTECKYSLMTFGLPTHCIPLDENMSLRRDWQMQWIQERRELESGMQCDAIGHFVREQEDFSGARHFDNMTVSDVPIFEEKKQMIAHPSNKDVLFGRGRPIQDHPGNKLFNSLVESMRSRYESLEQRSDKTMLSQMIVAKVKNAGGRFLKQSLQKDDRIIWEEADDMAAQAKVSHAFRSLKQLQKTRGNQRKRQTSSPVQSDANISASSSNGDASATPALPTGSFSRFFASATNNTAKNDKQNQWTNL